MSYHTPNAERNVRHQMKPLQCSYSFKHEKSFQCIGKGALNGQLSRSGHWQMRHKPKNT